MKKAVNFQNLRAYSFALRYLSECAVLWTDGQTRFAAKTLLNYLEYLERKLNENSSSLHRSGKRRGR